MPTAVFDAAVNTNQKNAFGTLESQALLQPCTPMTEAPKRRGVVVVEAPTTYSKAQAQHSGSRPLRRPPNAADGKAGAAVDDGKRGKKRGREQGGDGAGEEFRNVWASVTALGAAQFTGKQKKAHETARIVALGGKAPKAQNVPYKILMGMRAKAKQREEKRLAEEKASGVVSGYRGGSGGGSSGGGGDSGGGAARRREAGGGFKAKGGPLPDGDIARNGIMKARRPPTAKGGRSGGRR